MIITGRRRHRSGIWSERKSSDVSSGLTSASVEARSGNKKEQERIGRWAKEHAAQLIAAGAQEQWNRASCIAVPSDDPMGYDFIAMKEVKV